MKRVIWAFATMCILVSSTALASTQYIIANDNNPINNRLTVFQLDEDGTLMHVTSLATGGNGTGSSFSDFSAQQVAVTQNAACIFALNAATSDIASFSKATGYSRVGNYSNSVLSAGSIGGGIALTPNGKFLFGTYMLSENIGLWAVNPDCSLSFGNAYAPSDGGVQGAIKVTPNGRQLITPLGAGVEAFVIDSVSGSLTDLGFVSFANTGSCTRFLCFLGGVDVTKDNQLAVFAGTLGGDVAAFTARITQSGLQEPRLWTLSDPLNLDKGTVPFLDADAYAGSGSLFLSAKGGNDAQQPGGIIVAQFTEKPLNISFVGSTILNGPIGVDGGISVLGNTVIVAEFPNVIGSYLVNGDGTLSQLGSIMLQDKNAALFSIAAFPNSR